MSLLNALGVSASALTAERLRLETISENLANVYTTRTPSGDPYRRKMVAFATRDEGFGAILARLTGRGEPARGVQVAGIYEDPRPFKRVYAPDHPDADADGYVELPNVDIVEEMVNLIAATRAYEANVTAFNTTKALIQSALTIGS
ncbi:MAG TPA: flagellar basal body rod protein FlgC [Bacillota bacterium]